MSTVLSHVTIPFFSFSDLIHIHIPIPLAQTWENPWENLQGAPPKKWWSKPWLFPCLSIIELDDGKIYRKMPIFDGKNHGFL